MSLTKDGFYKQIAGVKGDNTYLLLAGGGHQKLGNASGNVPISNGTLNVDLNADKLDGVHLSGIFTDFSGGAISSSGNTLTQADHTIEIGGVTKSAGSSTANIINSLSVSKLTSSNATNLTVGITINGKASADKTLTDLWARYLANLYSSRQASMNVSFGDGSLRKFVATSTTTTGKPTIGDAHIIHSAWDNTGGYDAQIAIGTGGGMQYRYQSAGTWQEWRTLIDSSNYTNYVYGKSDSDDRYVNVIGDTMTGTLVFNYKADNALIRNTYGSTVYNLIRNHNNGNISISASSKGLYIGYENTTEQHFYTSGTDRMIIDSSGNVRPAATNTYTLGTTSYRWKALYIGNADSYGSATKPIYWNAGVPAACTYELKATINAGAANRMAYYSGANAISQASSIYASTNAITINGTSVPANSGNFQVVGTSTMRHIYPEAHSTYNLGTESFMWKYTYTKILNGAITGGTRTKAGGDQGSSANPRYFPEIWTFNSAITPTNGDIITIKTPGTGHDYGVFLSTNNGANYYPITLIGTGRMTTHFPTGSYLTLLFDSSNSAGSMFALAGQNNTSRVTISGGTWRVINYYDSGNTDVRYQQTIYYNHRQVASDGAIRRYTLCMMNYQGKLTSLTLTDNNTGTSKTMYTGYLDPRKIYYWAHTDNYAAGANMSRANTLLTHNGDLIDYRYTFNCGTTLTPRTSFYIVGTIDNNGFKLDPTQPWSCSLPTTDDGKVYIYVGMVYTDTNGYRGTLEENNTIYVYKNGAVQIWSGNAEYAKLLSPISENIRTEQSNWNIPSGSTQVWGQKWTYKTGTKKYTPSGGSATNLTDSGDWTIWLTPSATSNAATLNMRIDGTYYGSFSGNLSGNASTATKLQTARTINGVSFDGTTDISIATSLLISGNTIASQVGNQTSAYITVPFATNADKVDNEHEYQLRALPRNTEILYTLYPYLESGVNLDANTTLVTNPIEDEVYCYGKCWKNNAGNTIYSPWMRVIPGEVYRVDAWFLRKSGESGTEGTIYIGIEYLDISDKPINNNSGCIYLSGMNNATIPQDNKWYKKTATFTVPKTHTVYNGSSGKGAYKIRFRILLNHNRKTMPLYFGGVNCYKENRTFSITGNAATASIASKLGTSTVGGAKQPIYLSAGVATALSATEGSTSQPVYLNAGTITKISATKGGNTANAIKLMYLNAGVFTDVSVSSGATDKPVYVNGGSIVPITASKGSATKPVWLNAGAITACTYSLSATINAGAANRMAYYSGANAISHASSIYASTNAITINSTLVPANNGNFQVVGTSTMQHIYPEGHSTYNLGSESFMWKYTYTKILNGALTDGSNTNAVDSGASASPNRYKPMKWSFNSGITPTNGDIITIKTPAGGHDYGVFLSTNNGTNYYPITLSGTVRMTTHFPTGSYLILLFDSSNSAASMFALAGSDSRVTVSGGTWRVINYYDSGNPGDWNLRQYTIKAATAITSVHLIGGTDSGYNHIDSGTAFDIRYPVLYASSNISAGGTGNNNYIHHYSVNIRNNSNVNISGLTAYKNVYIKGTISGTIFTPISGGNPYTQTITESDDGYVYYYVGRAYASNAITFDGTGKDIYIYKDDKIQRWSGTADYALKATVNDGTANRVAWYNGSNSITSAANIWTNGTKLGINTTTEPSYNFYVNGTSYLSGNTTVAGHLYVSANNTYNLGASGTRWARAYIGSADSYGSTTKPIYWNAGVPTACTYELKATINNGTANRIAWYSGANAISSGSITTDGGYLGAVSYLSINNAHQTSYKLYINENRNAWATRSLEILAPNLTSGSSPFIVIGKADSAKNMAWMGYVHNADGGNANRLSFGLHSVDNLLNIFASGQISMFTTSPNAYTKLHINGNTLGTRIWLNHNSNLDPNYSWTGAALTVPTIEVQNYTGTVNDRFPTITLHHYGYGGPRLSSRQGVMYIYGGNTDARTLGARNSYFSSLKIYPNEIDGLYVNDDKVRMTGRDTNYFSQSTWNGLTPINAFGFRHGYPHFDDPDFASGNGGVGYYGRSQSTGTVTRMTDAQALAADSNYFASGNSSGYVLKISNTAIGSNNIGGFVQEVTSGDNKVWVQIFRALLPVGATLSYAANSMGSGAVVQWLTDNVGTGKWEWYAQIFYNGHGGTFSSFGHMSAFLTGATTSHVWYISYCNMYEISNGKYDGLRTRYTDNATNATNATNITVTNNITSNANYPIVWSNQNNTNNANANQLYKSYDQLLYNPSTKILSVNKINLNRAGNAAYGRIYYYNASYYTWVDYMSNSAAGAAPTGGQPSTTTEVTAWAKRSLIENASGYGWIWEACTNAAASATSTKPTARMSLSSYTGQLRIEANASSTSNNTGGLIVSSALNGNQNNISIELWRGSNASWSISNESGDLHIRDNFTTSAQTTFLHDNIKVAYNTGTISAKIIQPFTTNTYTLGSSSLRWKALYIGTADSYGSATKPIYWNAGVPAACTYELKATVNAGAANRMAYYSGANAISQASSIYASTTALSINKTSAPANSGNFQVVGTSTMRHIYPESDNTYNLGSTSLRWASVYAGVLRLQGPSSDPSASAGARIEFTYDNGSARSQPVYIAYTPNDGYRSPYGLKIFGSDGSVPGAWLEVEGLTYAKGINTAITGGTRTKAGGDQGSSANPRYFPEIWAFNVGIKPSNGDIITIKTPGPGHDYGVFLSTNNGANYYPITLIGTGRMTTHFPTGSYLTLLFDSSNSAGYMFALAGQNNTSRVTISGGTWRVLNYYDSGNPGEWNLRQYNIKAAAAINNTHIIGGTDSGYKNIDAGNAFDIRYPVLWAGSDISSGSAGSNNFIHHYAVNIRNRSNANISMTAYKNLYIKGTISGNTFTPINNTNPYVQDITTSDDGYVYYYVGRAYASNAITFDGTGKDIYVYKNGAIRRWVGYSELSKLTNLLSPISTTTTASSSTWSIPSGCKQVWGERFSDNTLKYTPSGGSPTTITDTGDWVIWLAPNATSNAATLNMRIDGTYYGSFSGNLSGNASTATKLQTVRTITIGATDRSFDGSANISWTLGDIIGTTPIGSLTKPIYWTGSAFAKTTYELKSTVNAGTANRIAYYSGANAISSGSIVTDGGYLGSVSYLSVNNAHQTDYRLYVDGTGYFTGTVTSKASPGFANDVAASSWAYIRFKSGTTSEWHVGTNSSTAGILGQTNAFEIRDAKSSYTGIAVRCNTSSYGKLVVTAASGETSIGLRSGKSGNPQWVFGIIDSSNYRFGFYNGGVWKANFSQNGYLYLGDGNTAASERLHVSGNTRITGDIRIEGNDEYLGTGTGAQVHMQYDNTLKCINFIFD